nr:putative receptor-like protein 8 [Lolium perenne]
MGSLSPWGHFSLVPFLLLQFMLHVSYGCSVEERAALLEIRSSLMRAHSLEVPDSWRKDDYDCCSWKHVKCNNRTQRVSHLDLSSVYATTEGDGHWFLNSTVFSVFHELQYLDLSYNSPCSLSLKGLVGLAKLRYLDLSGTMWGVGFPEFIGEIVSLEVLALNDNNITGGLPGKAVKNLRNLRQLNMTSNSCHGNLPESLFSLPHLKILDLSANIFGGHIPISSASRPISLEVLDLSSNQLNGTLPVAAFQNIRNLNLSGNQFRGSLPVSLFALPHLKFLDLSYNNFEGRFPISLSPEPVPLEVLNLHYNNMSVHATRNLSQGGEVMQEKTTAELWVKLEEICLSKDLTGRLHVKMKLFSHKLQEGGSVEHDIEPATYIEAISSVDKEKWDAVAQSTIEAKYIAIAEDIRHNQFMGNLHWVRYLGNTRLLFLSGNKFEGQISPILCKLLYLRIIDLSHNKLSGSLPACIGNISFKGETDDQIFQPVHRFISYFYRNFYAPKKYSNSYDFKSFAFATKGNLYTYGRSFFLSMSGIDLSANMLDGEIPWELGNLSRIKSLNLSYNFFVGPIPATFGGMKEIESLDLSHNELSGLIPQQLTQLSSLGVFSVAYNNLSGCIPNSGQRGSFGIQSYLANTNLHKITHGNMCTAPGPDPAPEEHVGEMFGDPVLYVVTAATFVLALGSIGAAARRARGRKNGEFRR